MLLLPQLLDLEEQDERLIITAENIVWPELLLA